jgi:hypothetical protein
MLRANGEDGGDEEQDGDLVELRRVSRAVAEIDRPGEIRVVAVGVIGQTGEEAADASDGDAEEEGGDISIAAAAVQAAEFFGDFDADPPAQQSADDRFAFSPDHRVVAVMPVLREGFDDGQEFCADECADDRPGDEPDVRFGVDG